MFMKRPSCSAEASLCIVHVSFVEGQMELKAVFIGSRLIASSSLIRTLVTVFVISITALSLLSDGSFGYWPRLLILWRPTRSQSRFLLLSCLSRISSTLCVRHHVFRPNLV